jgi:Pregnancy-associated plasma protein-A
MTRLRRTLVLFATLALLATQLALPGLALAKGANPAWACGPEAAGASARGGMADSRGTIREKDTGQVVSEMPASAKGQAPAAMTVSVATWFHVITNGSTGNLTNTQIQTQLNVMNSAFAGSDTGFSFTLGGITRTSNATWYASKSAGAEHAMKQALKVPGDNILNVYTSTAGSYLGYAYLPEITNTAQAYLDGVVVDWETFPNASDTWEGIYDQGMTLVHETGHWLNLEHTFYGGCNKGDFVADTPPEKSAAFGCQVGRDTCNAAGVDPIHNYMDYSDDPCLTEFTAGQGQRMRDAWLLWRAT